VYLLNVWYPDITHSPLLFTLTAILLHYLDEAACYTCISALVASKQRYVTQTVISHRAQTLVLSELAFKHAVCTFIVGPFFLKGGSCVDPVRLSVCPVPPPRGKTKRPTNTKLGGKGPWDTSTPWTNFKVKGS